MGISEVLAEIWGEVTRIKLLVNKVEKDIGEIKALLQLLLADTEVVIAGDN